MIHQLALQPKLMDDEPTARSPFLIVSLAIVPPLFSLLSTIRYGGRGSSSRPLCAVPNVVYAKQCARMKTREKGTDRIHERERERKKEILLYTYSRCLAGRLMEVVHDDEESLQCEAKEGEKGLLSVSYCTVGRTTRLAPRGRG